MKKLKELSPITVGLVQAIGLFAYCVLVGWFLFVQGEKILDNVVMIVGPIAILLTFVLSAAICGLIMFGYPFILFTNTKKFEKPVKIVGYTTMWLTVITVMVFVLASLC